MAKFKSPLPVISLGNGYNMKKNVHTITLLAIHFELKVERLVFNFHKTIIKQQTEVLNSKTEMCAILPFSEDSEFIVDVVK